MYQIANKNCVEIWINWQQTSQRILINMFHSGREGEG